MIYITFLILLIKSLLFLTITYVPSLLLKLIIALSIISWFCYITRRQVITKILYLNRYRIVNPFGTILFVISITICVICTLFSFKILNIGKTIDLYQLYVYLEDVFNTTSYVDLFVNVLLIIAFIFLGFMIYKTIKKFVFEEFISIHIYLSQFNYDWYTYYGYHESNNYQNVGYFFMDNFNYLTYKILEYFCYDSTNKKFIVDEKYRFIHKYGYKVEENLGFVILIVTVLYDCIFNNFVLMKLYYVFPFIYIYILWRLLVRFYCNRYSGSDWTLSIMLYYKRIGVSEYRRKILAVYENGVELDEEDLLDAYDYVFNNFRYIPNDSRIKERRERFEAYLEFVKNTKQHKDGYLVFTDNEEQNKKNDTK